MEKYITGELFKFCKSDNATKIAKRVYEQVLNYDKLEVVQIDDRFYIQKVYSTATIPEYAYKFVKGFYQKQGLKYLYD
jgi:hypothetical protein